MAKTLDKPKMNEYFMQIAMSVRRRADCRGQRVGAVIVMDERVVSTGYNGTPANFLNCSDGGCVRCENRGKEFPSGTGYDVCVCVHAEQNAILSAARFGIRLQEGTLYTTVEPCFGCLKEMLQIGIQEVYYLHPWIAKRSVEQQKQYDTLKAVVRHGVTRLQMDDPDFEWAKAPAPAALTSDTHGMETV
jgi:dCMP deaminase